MAKAVRGYCILQKSIRGAAGWAKPVFKRPEGLLIEKQAVPGKRIR
jgi:hypothetical protein